jgi:hypothetical protein
MKRTRLLLSLFCFLTFIPVVSSQVTRYVAPTGSNSNTGLTEVDPYATIQFAIDNSVNGDSVLIFQGLYNENINFNGRNITVSSLFARTNDTTFISSTIIDGGANGFPVVKFMNGEDNLARLVGLTIQNGLTALNEEGAGIHIGGWYTSPILSNLIVQNNNSASGKGGGIHANAYYSSPTITSCTIRNNTSSASGGGISITSAEPLISKCRIYNNSAPDNGSAISHHLNTSDLSAKPITNCLMYGNIGPSVIAGTGVALVNSTVVMNNGSINVNGSSTVLNSIIGENTPINSQAQLNIKNSIIESGLSSVSVPLQVYLTTSNVVVADPEFNDPSSNDYSLKNYSAGIGYGILSHTVGSNTYTAPSDDINDGSRPIPIGSNADLGAIENVLGSPSNAPPVIDPVGNITVNEDEVTEITLTGIGDGDYFSVQNITISASSDNLSLMPDPIVNYVNGQNTAILTLSPLADLSGTLTITVVLQDDGGTINGGIDQTIISFLVTILPVNDAPMAINDIASTDEDTQILINVISNDTDIDGNIDPSTVQIVSPPNNGIVIVDVLTGSVTYTPNENFNGTDSFVYQVCDDGTPLPALCSSATVSITVNPVNDLPIANNDSAITNEDTEILIDILANDSDVDGNIVPGSVIIVSGPTNGVVNIESFTGVVTYIPNENFNGTDSFVYQVCDDGTPLPAECASATVIITIIPVNDAPLALFLSNSSLPENQQNVLIGSFSSEDIDTGDSFTYALVSGSGSADNGYFYIDGNQLFNNIAFNYEAQYSYSIRVRSTDLGGLFVEEVFTIEVLNVNDISIDFSTGNTYCDGPQGIGWINSTISDFNGSLNFSWSGPNGFNSDQQNITGLGVGQYTLTVTDDFHSYSESVLIETLPVYNGLEVCYVTSDTLNTQRNRIYFSNPGVYNVDNYQILRESVVVGVYDLIGQVNASDTSFLDNGSDNNSVSYKYRVRSLDSCGNFSSESASHRTILLQANLGLNNTVNLSWNPYEGISYSTYVVYRSMNGESFQELISLPTSNTSFNDVSADVSINTYIYYVAIPISTCDFTKVATMLRSNEKYVSPLSIHELSSDSFSISVYPNPTFDLITVEADWIEGEEYQVFDLLGRKVLNGQFASSIHTIKLSNLARGQYTLRIGSKDVRILKQ